MAGRIPKQFIDDLLMRVDLVEVIDARVPLKKAGKDFKACCPFHDEKTPSFTVSPTKQFYHCFGCGVHGTAIGFLMDYEHLEFREAVEELARQVGLTVPQEPGGTPVRDDRAADLLGLMQDAARFYRRQLREHRQAGQAVDYLKGRGITGEIAARFGLGYAPPGWDNLIRELGRDAQARAALVTAGLAVKKDDGGHYDRFRSRIMFPIHDYRGRIVGFGGRVIGEGEPKYLNSPETPLFHKGRELYGLFGARDAIRRASRALIVEGYMDVVALAQFGIDNAVATLGTATTREHLERLFRLTPEVVFCFDGDRAGREAAWRALEIVLPVLHEGRQVSFLFLPEGEDPDSLVRKEGAVAFGQRAAHAKPLPDFLFDSLAARVDRNRLDGRARLVELARPLLARLPGGVFRQMMLERLGQITQVDSQKLTTLIESDGNKTHFTSRSAPAAGPAPKEPPTAMRMAVALLIQHPELAGRVPDGQDFADLDLPGVSLLRTLIELLRTRPDLNTAAVVEYFRDSEHQLHVARLAAMEHPVLSQPEPAAELEGALEQLRRLHAKSKAEGLLRKGGLNSAEKAELARLLAGKRE